MPLLELPPELLVQILAELTLPALTRCKSVCKFLHNTITHTVQLQYAIELHAAGLVESPAFTTSASRSALPISTRLARLRTHLTAWRTLTPTSRHTFTLPENTGSTYELYDGVLARGLGEAGTRRTDGMWFGRMPGGSLAGAFEERRQGESWVKQNLGIPVADFTMAASDDVIVFIEKRPNTLMTPTFSIHLLTLSTLLSHPSATRSVLIHDCMDTRPVQDYAVMYNYYLALCGPYLAALFLPHMLDMAYLQNYIVEELVIWDWRTGKVRAKMAVYEDDGAATSVVWVREDPPAFVVGSILGGTALLSLYSLDPDPTRTAPILVARFELPRVRYSEVSHESVLIRSDPTPARPPPTARHQPLFIPAPSARLYVVSLKIDAVAPDSLNALTVFVLLPTLLAPLSASAPPPSRSSLARTIPWSEWAPHTRALEHDPGDANPYVCYVHGYRYITSVPVRGDRSRRVRIQIWDFNPYLARMEAQKQHDEHAPPQPQPQPRRRLSAPPGPTGGLFSYFRTAQHPPPPAPPRAIILPSHLPAQSTFLQAVRSGERVPYVVTECAEVGREAGLFVDGERVVRLVRGREEGVGEEGRERLDCMVF